jgi:hypothetical protein
LNSRRAPPLSRLADVKRTPSIRDDDTDAGLERIKDLEIKLALAPANSHERRTLRAAIRVEADAYRKSLDVEQASAAHDERNKT